MKLKTPEVLVIAVTAGIMLFTLGYFTGRATATPDGGIAVITQRPPALTEAPAETEAPPPEETEETPPEELSAGVTEDGKIDINLADAETLTELPGIGPKTAEAIVSYREALGPFDEIDDLMEVGGIGEGKMADLRELICVGGSGE
ncbi:MAG: ComEA family DNA-binding protein [Oscillospiraceae bacterium]|nr:ComEA family DNA-binding protein [Oscillospiraceae bacterium]